MELQTLTIRPAEERDRPELIRLYELSQQATGIPNPAVIAPSELGRRLYQRQAVRRLVAERAGKLIGHGLVELPNPDNIPDWLNGSARKPEHLLELGGAFVHPEHSGQGVWTTLLERRLEYVRSITKTAVAATWSQNTHVMRRFDQFGGTHLGSRNVKGGNIELFRFD